MLSQTGLRHLQGIHFEEDTYECFARAGDDNIPSEQWTSVYERGSWYLAGLAQNQIRYFRLEHIKSISLPS
jgi:hypothetical protein